LLSSTDQIQRSEEAETTSNERPREEALRYLLWHLSGVKRPSETLRESVT
jgi:hypothetical protein